MNALIAPTGGLPGLLVEVVRSGHVESSHRGHLGVYDPDGTALLLVGDPASVGYPRSAVKPLQALAMLRHGAVLDGEQLALAAASHSGEPRHTRLVAAMLAAAGLCESDLQCPAAWPLVGAQHGEPTRLAMNCSGKHAGMLTACVAAGDEVGSYLDPAHPLQRRIRETIEDLTGVPVTHTAVDGCGAPLYAFAWAGLARAFARLVQAPAGSPERRVADAMRDHPELVGGVGRDVTALMRAVPGLLAKDGAEGVYAAALPGGSAVVVKVEDGGDRARVPALIAGLRRAGADLSAVPAALVSPPVLGGGLPVGELRTVIRAV